MENIYCHLICIRAEPHGLGRAAGARLPHRPRWGAGRRGAAHPAHAVDHGRRRRRGAAPQPLAACPSPAAALRGGRLRGRGATIDCRAPRIPGGLGCRWARYPVASVSPAVKWEHNPGGVLPLTYYKSYEIRKSGSDRFVGWK